MANEAKELTEEDVQNIRHSGGLKRREKYAVGGVGGLRLFVTHQNIKSWGVRIKRINAPDKEIYLGKYPEISLTLARKLAIIEKEKTQSDSKIPKEELQEKITVSPPEDRSILDNVLFNKVAIIQKFTCTHEALREMPDTVFADLEEVSEWFIKYTSVLVDALEQVQWHPFAEAPRTGSRFCYCTDTGYVGFGKFINGKFISEGEIEGVPKYYKYIHSKQSLEGEEV